MRTSTPPILDPAEVSSLGIDHVTYGLFDFSLSFLIYLVITFLVHLHQHTGQNANRNGTLGVETGEGYAKLDQAHELDEQESFELADQDLSGDEDAVKIGTEDEVDWLKSQPNKAGVRI